MIELRNLGYLLVACGHENLSRAAERLCIAPSTLSASLKSLETELGFTLFKRSGSGLYPSAGARWLFRAGLPLLLLEGHARRRLALADGVEPRRLNLDIGLSFTLGHVTKAVLRAIADTADQDPTILVNPTWSHEEPTPFDAAWVDKLGLRSAGSVSLDMVGRPADPMAGEIALMRDPWVLACRIPAAQFGEDASVVEMSARKIIVPSFSQALLDQVEAHLRAHDVRSVSFLPDHPASLPRLMNEHPDAAFLLPGSTLAERLGMLRVGAAPIDPPFTTTLVARVSEPGEAVDRFIERLRIGLAEPDQAIAFAPELTSRRIRYFNLAHRLRSVSAAARVANVAQPAMSEQLRKLELTLGAKLFDRRSDGVLPTPSSAKLAPVSITLENGLRELKISGMSAESPDAVHLSLGVLPSVNQHGFLINRITEAMLALRARHPGLKVTVQEGPNGTLQEWVKRGVVGMAIVETGPAQLPRLPLDAFEPLAAIAHPRHGLLPPGPVRFADLVKTPLVLPTAQFGLRQLLDTAARSQRLELRPSMQIDALTMLIALLRREPMCTILPRSAVRAELDRGDLCAHAIIEPSVIRRLFVIYSGDRSLTEPERELVAMLRAGLSEGEIDDTGAAKSPPPTHAPFTAALH